MAAPQVSLSQKQAALLVFGAVMVLAVIVLAYTNLRPKNNSTVIPLIIWGTEPRSVFQPIFESYTQTRSNVTFQYEQINPDEYDSTILRALASGEGPDIMMIQNNSLELKRDILSPVSTAQFSLIKFRELFPTVAEQDFVRGNDIFALPLYVDTLSLIYNKTQFDQAGIAIPPATWTDLQSLISKLRSLNAQGQIVRAAAGIGGSGATIEYAPDILYSLMLQNGSKIFDTERGSLVFASEGGAGLNAFRFYLQFANAGSPYYTWNDAQPRSIESFVSGKTSMIFAYHADTTSLKKRNPFLSFDALPLPQVNPEAAVNYPRYDGFAVSKKSENSAWAWDFVLFATTDQGVNQKYLTAASHPPALRSLILQNLSDTELGVFARQALSARSWQMKDPEKTTEVINEAIRNVISGKLSASEALRESEDKIIRLYY